VGKLSSKNLKTIINTLLARRDNERYFWKNTQSQR